MATGSPASPTALQSESIDLPIFEPEGNYEVLYGEVVEKPAMGVFETWIATKLSGWPLRSTGVQDHGRVVSEMLFLLDLAKDLNCRPDLAFVSYERWARTRPVPRVAAWDVIPDLAIEVISPTNLATKVIVKVRDYFKYGVSCLWVVYPVEELIYVYDSPTSIQVLTVATPSSRLRSCLAFNYRSVSSSSPKAPPRESVRRGGELRANAGPALFAGSSPRRSGKSWNAPIVAPLIKCREQDPGHRQCLAYPSRITLTMRHVPLVLLRAIPLN